MSQVLRALPKAPEILWLTPQSVSEIFENVRDLGAATGKSIEATTLIQTCEARLEALTATVAKASYRPRVFCMEWLDPVYASGHWVPELVKFAGGVDELGSERGESVRVSWKDIVEWAPEVLIMHAVWFQLAANDETDLERVQFTCFRLLQATRGSQWSRLCSGCQLILRASRPESS